MTKFLTGAILLATLLLTPASAQQARQDFTLVNRTGYDISEVYVEDGNSTTIRFKRATRSCMWDLKVVYSDDDSNAVWKDIDLCRVAKITLRYNRATKTTSAEFD